MICGLLSTCGAMKASTADGIFVLVVVSLIVYLGSLVIAAANPSIESRKLEDSRVVLTSKKEQLVRVQEFSATIEDACILMEETDPDDMLHDAYRARLEGLQDDLQKLRESIYPE